MSENWISEQEAVTMCRLAIDGLFNHIETLTNALIDRKRFPIDLDEFEDNLIQTDSDNEVLIRNCAYIPEFHNILDRYTRALTRISDNFYQVKS